MNRKLNSTHHKIVLFDAVRILADQLEGGRHKGHFVLGQDGALLCQLCARVAHFMRWLDCIVAAVEVAMLLLLLLRLN